MTPILPSHTPPSRTRSTLGWLASSSAAALMVSGIAALAMSYQPAGESMGDSGEPMLIILPSAAAVEAMAEPSPDVSEETPDPQEQPEEVEPPPETPELTEAPDLPEDVPLLEELAADELPEVDTDAPPAPQAEVAVKKPKARPQPPEKPVKQAEKPKQERKEKPRKPPAAQSVSQASSQPATQSQSGAASLGSGSASAASYGADVMKKIQRTKKKRAAGRGSATVAFAITEGGSLSSATISVSSGSAEIDRLALDHVQRSAPFSPPPAGAKRQFSFNYKAD